MSQLMKVEETQLAHYEAYQGEGYEGFGESELIKPPVLGISQPTSDHKPEGEFYINATGETLGKQVRAVLLHLQRTMVYRPGGGYDTPATCWSRSFWTPAEDVPDRQCHTCHKRTPGKPIPVCPMAQWRTEGDKRISPPCAETWVAGIALLDENFQVQQTALLYFRSMSLGPVRNFMGQMRTLYKRLPLFGVAVDLALVYKTKKEGFQGNFYLPDFPDLKSDLDAGRFHIMPPQSLQALHELHTFFREYLEGAGLDEAHDEIAEAPAASPSAHPQPPQGGPTPTPASPSAKTGTSASAPQGWGA